MLNDVEKAQTEVDLTRQHYDNNVKIARIFWGCTKAGIAALAYLGLRYAVGVDDIEGFNAMQQGVLDVCGETAKYIAGIGLVGALPAAGCSKLAERESKKKLEASEKKLQELVEGF